MQLLSWLRTARPSSQEPLIGRRLVHAGELVPLAPAFVDAVSTAIAPLRPAHRAAHGLDRSAAFALLLPNFSSPDRVLSGALASTSSPRLRAPSLSVEIKPKCGFLPASAAVCPVKGALKRATSRFQLHQYLKVQSGKYARARFLV